MNRLISIVAILLCLLGFANGASAQVWPPLPCDTLFIRVSGEGLDQARDDSVVFHLAITRYYGPAHNVAEIEDLIDCFFKMLSTFWRKDI